MSKEFYKPTRIKLYEDFSGIVTENDGDQWFDIVFDKTCRVVFEVNPSSDLDVNFSAWNGDEMRALQVENSNGRGITEKIELGVRKGQRIKLDVQHQSGSGSFILSCKMADGSTMPIAERIEDNIEYPSDLIRRRQEHWYYVQFDSSGKANFFVEPENHLLDIDIVVRKDSITGDLVGEASSKGLGQWELIEKVPVAAGVKYYIGIYCHFGIGKYNLKCRNYTDTNKIKKIGLQKMKLNLLKDKSDKTSSINTIKVYNPDDYEGKDYRYFHENLKDIQLLDDEQFDCLKKLKEKLFGGDYGKISAYFGEYYLPLEGHNRKDIENGKGYLQGLHEGFDMSHSHKCKLYAFGKGEVLAKPANNWANTLSIVYDKLPGYRVTYLHAHELYVDENSKVDENTCIGLQGNKGVGSSHVHWEIRKMGIGSNNSAASSLGNNTVDNNITTSLLKKLL